jgi:hypothetical protein
MAKLSEGYQALASVLEAGIMHSDVSKRLSDAVNDAHRASGSTGGYIDHSGDGTSGDCIYSCDGDIRKAAYTLGTANGKQTADIDMDDSKNVTPVTSYEEEADDDDQYAGMEERYKREKLYTADSNGSYIPVYERFISKGERDSADSGDFAGKGKSYPILKPGDVSAAVHAMGRAGSSNLGMSSLKKNIISIAKRKGWGKYLPKSWQDGSDDSSSTNGESVPRGTFSTWKPDGVLICRESSRFIESPRLSEAATTAYPMKLISPGRGSSGFYTPAVLKQAAENNVFKAGTHMFWNHDTDAEESARPEGDLNRLAAVTTTDAVWNEAGPDGPGLYSNAKVFEDYAKRVKEMGPHIGLSIRAGGARDDAKEGPDGKRGVITALHNAHSVDFVTRAGRDGKIFTESHTTEGEEDMTESEVKRLIESANRPLVAENKRLREQLIRTSEAPPIIRKALESISWPAHTEHVVRERITRNVCALDIPLTESGAVDEAKLTASVMQFAKQEALDLEKMGHGAVHGLGSGASGDPIKADEAWTKERDETLSQLSEVFMGEGKENKRRRKAFIEGRAA